MCRFAAYHGPPISLDELLYRPAHSIIHQSTHATEREGPLNGDGWGLGWYDPRMAEHPAVYRTLHPAWSDQNMRHIAPLIETPLFMAHVRAASGQMPVHQHNCHPFRGGEGDSEDTAGEDPIEWARRRLLFMHNGHMAGCRRVIRRLHRELSDEVFFGIDGSTDSEHAFALVQQELGKSALAPSTEDLATAVERSLGRLLQVQEEVNPNPAFLQFNACLTDGRSIVATRFAHHADQHPEGTPSLYVGRAQGFSCKDGEFRSHHPGAEGAVLVASERLWEDERVWEPIPKDHLVMVDPQRKVTVRPLEVGA